MKIAYRCIGLDNIFWYVSACCEFFLDETV